ncbi:OLC1v1018813C1 [Oldenlandia corymbosa var. corymbosa]|uniref:OLC1v1018813C1 n=1 Tax=Oldenlandia corymbosa var. corymbosa TaxID=529605 RepID=A0AAV1ECK5_OLDCO|nr:OLC1v1018813C1 [Oldenlandia corymbosa var. corymbosa]
MFTEMSYQMILCISLFISLFPCLLLIKKWKEPRRGRFPPGPPKLPIIGNLHQLGNLPHRSLHHLSNKCGPLMLLRLGSVNTLVVSSADMAREIFKSHDLAFSGRPVLCAGKKLAYNGSAVSFAPYGEYWREMRKVLVLELLSVKKVQFFEAIRDEKIASMLKSIADCISSEKMPINLSKLAISLSNNVICRVAFGRIYDEKSEFDRILYETQELLGEVNVADFVPWLGWINNFNGMNSRIDKNFRELDEFFDKVITEHLDPNRARCREEEDIVDVLLRLQRNSSQPNRPTDEHVKGVLADVLAAGSDTSAATLEWTMAELIRNPSVMKKAQMEIREICEGKDKVEETDLAKLKYLKCVVKESLRMHPPLPLLIPRETLEDCIVGGYTIPAKTRVFLNVTAISNDPKCWDNPEEFNPERFLDSGVDFRGQNFELLPFGAGRRSCPGINFAVPLVELALANLLLVFDWVTPEGIVAEDLDMEEGLGLTVHKKTPLCLMVANSTYVKNR